MIEYVLAQHDPEFEAEWLSDEDILEGSPSRGFQTVQVVGYRLSRADQLTAVSQELRQRKQANRLVQHIK
jgi:hypothetical protein